MSVGRTHQGPQIARAFRVAQSSEGPDLDLPDSLTAEVDPLSDFVELVLAITADYNVFAGSDVNGDGNPTSDRPGTLGRNTLEGPGFATVDLRVGREFHLSERLSLDLSADLFNLLNRTNIKDLNTLYGAPDLSRPPDPNLGFGTARDVGNPFQFQYGAKL